MLKHRAVTSVAMYLFVLSTANAATLPAERIVEVGEQIGGVEITNLNEAHVNDDGVPGFTGVLANTDRFVWYEDGPIWLNSDEVNETLTGAEVTMGIGNNGEFVYSTSITGDDGIWTQNGEVTHETLAIPGFGGNTVSTFHSRPTMIGSGQSYWIAGFNDNGGTITQGRALLTSPDNTPGNIFAVLRSDDVIEGLPIARPSGLDFDYDLSADGLHHIHVLQLDSGSTTDDGVIYVDGAIVARESLSTGGGDNWANFDLVTINNAGNFLFTGDTDGATTSDEFIAYNGAIVLREGDTVDGLELMSNATLRFAALNNDNSAVYGWGFGGQEHVFFACDASQLVDTTTHVLATGVDGLDFDQDDVEDVLVTDLKASTGQGQAVSLADDGFVFLEVEIDDGVAREAIVRLPLPSCCGDGILQAGREECDDGNADDTDMCPTSCFAATCGDGFVLAGEEACDDGNDIDTDACTSACVEATCGDGFVWEGVEACDDGNDDDNDDCLQSCEVASCGDGFIHQGFESCDDGNNEDGDGCDAECLIEVDTDSDATTETTAGPTDSDTDTDTDSDTDIETTETSDPTDPTSDTDDPTQTTDPTEPTEASTGEPTDATTTSPGTTTGDPSSTTAGPGESETADSESTGDGNTDSGGVSEPGGCSCMSVGNRAPGNAAGLLGLLGLIAWRRRR